MLILVWQLVLPLPLQVKERFGLLLAVLLDRVSSTLCQLGCIRRLCYMLWLRPSESWD